MQPEPADPIRRLHLLRDGVGFLFAAIGAVARAMWPFRVGRDTDLEAVDRKDAGEPVVGLRLDQAIKKIAPYPLGD